MNHSWCLLTCVKVSVLSEVLSYTVKLFSRVVTTVAVKRDTGREVHHQEGQGGDLLQNRPILLQQGGHVSFESGRKKGREYVKSTFVTLSAVTFKVSYEIINHPALLSAILLCISASKIQVFGFRFKTK